MGAMVCFREDCEHALCDRYSREFGYICWRCFDELKKYCKVKGNCSPEIIREFMKTSAYTPVFDPNVETNPELEKRIEEYLDSVFR